MLQDLDAGRDTEVDVVNGGVASKGRELGIATPHNDAVVELVHSMERGERAPDPKWLRYVSEAQITSATDS
jgi:2-dehydropantoate 2-reductase